MFDFVNNNRQFASIALGLVGIGLMVGTGISARMGGGESTYLAKVDGQTITERDLAIRSRGQNLTDVQKGQLLGQLVQRQTILNEATQRNLIPSNSLVREYILKMEPFKGDNGQFDEKRYMAILAAQQLPVNVFEADIRDELQQQLLGGAIQQGGFVSSAVADRLANALTASRSVQAATFMPASYADKVTVSDADIKKYYDAHHGDFNQPERVKLDYIVLSRDEMAAGIAVDDAKVKDYFEQHKSELAQEERHVRHILVKVDAKAPEAEKAAARKKAEAYLAEVKKNPSSFAEVAKQHSDDPGSAAQGGDLGYFANNGTMVKPFADTAFKLAKGQISDLVETQFGFHIIEVEDIRAKTFDDVKATVVARLQHDQAQQKFQASVDKFDEAVYQQPDSLQPAADTFKLEVRHSDWLTRDAAAEPMLNDQKVRDAAFSPDVLTKKHNSEAIELAPGNKIVVRVAQHEAAKLLPMADVSAKIIAKIKEERGVTLAIEAGKNALAALQKGEQATVEWQPAKPVGRLEPAGLSKAAVDAVFSVAESKLPGYVGVQEPTGYAVYKVSAGTAKVMTAQERDALTQNIAQTLSAEQVGAYFETVRKQHKVETH